MGCDREEWVVVVVGMCFFGLMSYNACPTIAFLSCPKRERFKARKEVTCKCYPFFWPAVARTGKMVMFG